MPSRDKIATATLPPPICEVQRSNGNTWNTARPNRKWKIQDGGRRCGKSYISACSRDSNQISTAIPPIPPFSRSSNLMEKLGIMCYQTRGGKFKMASADAKILISQLADVTATTFRRLASIFEVQQSNGNTWITARPKQKWKI